MSSMGNQMRKHPDYMKEVMAKNTSSQRSSKPKSTSRIEPIDKASILLDLIRSRRSIRFFKKTPIPDEHLMMILEGARWAPSPANAQPWEFLVIKDQRVKVFLAISWKKYDLPISRRLFFTVFGNRSDHTNMVRSGQASPASNGARAMPLAQ